MATAIKVEDLSKIYRLGEIGTGTLSQDLHRWWNQVRGKEDPFLKIGQKNVRTQKGTSEIVYSLQDLNFEIQQGDAVGIIGRNGAGKSTLLKVLSRVTSPTTGSIKINGRIASLLEVGTGFHPELTGRENIYLNGAILGMRKSEITRKFDEIVAFSGVERYIDTPVKRYSSGMYVRLAFAVAAHLDSEILIVDEVLAVGDAEFQRKCLGKMGDISKGQGRTVLFVSHQLGMIQSLCSSAIYLQNGMIKDKGDVQDVIRNYISTSKEVSSAFKNELMFDLKNQLAAQVLSLKLVDEKGQVKNDFDVFENKYLVVSLKVNETLNSATLFYNLKKDEDIIVCSHENDFLPERIVTKEVGTYTYTIKLPDMLKAGVYSFDSIGIGIPNVGPVDKVSGVLEFEISEFSFDGSLKGFAKKRPGFIVFDSVYDFSHTPLLID